MVVEEERFEAGAGQDIEIDAADGEKGRKWKKDTKIEGTNSDIYGKQRT